MQLSGLEETHRNKSADVLQRDNQSPPQHSDAPTDEHIMQRQPRRSATRQRTHVGVDATRSPRDFSMIARFLVISSKGLT